MEKNDDYTVASLSPSFSTYSDDRIAEIAEQVTRTFSDEEFEFAILETPATSSSSGGVVFPVFDRNLVSETIAVESEPILTSILQTAYPGDDGGVVFPVFDRNLVSETIAVESESVLTPLADLFLRERNDPPPQRIYSSSSDEEEEDDELDAIPSEIYCPWTPARSTADMSPSGGCRKSKSTGSSSTSSRSTKRWRIRDLLKRSRSDGKQTLKFLNPNSIREESSKKKESVSAHEKFYLRNKAIKEEDKRKSYLPYKQDLFGLFSNINRRFPHF